MVRESSQFEVDRMIEARRAARASGQAFNASAYYASSAAPAGGAYGYFTPVDVRPPRAAGEGLYPGYFNAPSSEGFAMRQSRSALQLHATACLEAEEKAREEHEAICQAHMEVPS